METQDYNMVVPIDLRLAADADAFAAEGARLFAELATAVSRRGQAFTVALSGGSTPKMLFDRLSAAYRLRLDWATMHVFWVDERPVPPTHDDSNYRLAKLHLLDNVAVSAANIHRIKTEAPLSTAATVYSAEICRFFELREGAWPRFDLIILGLGEDGHTASLFPGTQALENIRDLAVCNDVPKLHETRITLTFPVINAAACVLVLVSGARKRRIVHDVLTTPPNPMIRPIQAVAPLSGRLIWLVDRAAADDLNLSSS